MTAQPTEITTASSIAAATGVRQHVIAVREAVFAKTDELVAYEDDLTIHRIALQVLAARPEAVEEVRAPRGPDRSRLCDEG